MIKQKTLLFLSLVCMTFLFIECKKKNKEEEVSPEDSFDKTGMLVNVGQNVIIPAYAELKITTDSLKYYTDLFVASPTLPALTTLQTHFVQAYSRFQWVSTFEFGPADSELLRANFNIFPCDTTQINTKIAASDFGIATVADLDAKGFPAIDFLLYRSLQNSTVVLAKFTSDPNAANAKTYLTTLVNELKTKTDAVNAAWSSSGGNYISTFTGNTGSNVGSSIGLLVNQLCYDLEILKNAEIGIPAGKKSLGTPLPEKSQAVYSTKSLLLAAEHLKALENIYLGRSLANADGIGLDDYVAHVNAQHSNGPLNDVIKNKFTSAKAKLALVPETLSQSVISNQTLVDDAYNELQQLVVLLKVDMTSSLGIMITYQDNDGD